MLIEFKAYNYRSIGEEQILSLVPATRQKDHLQNIISRGKHQALNVLALYGPNGGGKSNVLRAMGLLSHLVQHSARSSSTARLPYDPFLLRESWSEKPTSLEVTFVMAGVRYRYGLQYNSHAVIREWLFRKSVGREVAVFEREGEIIEVSSGYQGTPRLIEAAIEATRINALFLSTCDMFNIPEARSLLDWFGHCHLLNGSDPHVDTIQTSVLWNQPEYRPLIRQYLTSLSLQIPDLNIAPGYLTPAELPPASYAPAQSLLPHVQEPLQPYRVEARHYEYDAQGIRTNRLHAWDWEERESSGTQKAFQMSGPVLWALVNGGLLIIDEIEAKMHPAMTLHTIEAFLHPASNPRGAQLIFATHDTNLLTYSALRRDQIYFAEKNDWESTEVYSLSDFVYFSAQNEGNRPEKERPDTDKEKRYIEGRYGAIPALGSFRTFIQGLSWQNGEK